MKRAVGGWTWDDIAIHRLKFITRHALQDLKIHCRGLAACVVSLAHAQPLALGIGGEGASDCVPVLAKSSSCWLQLTAAAPRDGINIFTPSSSRDVPAAVAAGAAPRALAPQGPLQLSNLEAVSLEGLKLIGQRCHVQGSHRFKGLVHAMKYASRLAASHDLAGSEALEPCKNDDFKRISRGLA